MDFLSVVTTATTKLQLLNQAGKLKPLDSMAMVKVAVAIEDATGLVIPPERVVPKDFRTIESIVQLCTQLSAELKPPP
jgi:acyl carrier protein